LQVLNWGCAPERRLGGWKEPWLKVGGGKNEKTSGGQRSELATYIPPERVREKKGAPKPGLSAEVMRGKIREEEAIGEAGAQKGGERVNHTPASGLWGDQRGRGGNALRSIWKENAILQQTEKWLRKRTFRGTRGGEKWGGGIKRRQRT